MNGKALSRLGDARLYLRQKAKHWRPLILKLVPIEVPGYGTMGITKHFVMPYDPDFVMSLSIPQLAGCLVHEVLHPFLKHHERYQPGLDAGLFNESGDRVINPIVLAMPGLELPEGLLLPSDLQMLSGLTVMEYYNAAAQQGQQGRKPKKGTGKPGSGEHSGHEGDKPIPGLPSEEELSKIGRTETEVHRAVKAVAEGLKQEAAKGQGSLPAGLARLIEATLAPPKVRWQEKLKHAVRNAVEYREGSTVPDHSRFHRKQAAMGFGPGVPVMHAWYKPVPHVAFALDTSGSMGEEELKAALREARGVLKAVGADVTFLSCDTKVHAAGKVHDVKEMVKMVKGGGGTDFCPVFENLLAMHPRNRPSLVIFATDGYGSAPEHAPRGIDTIWLLIGGKHHPATWGKYIEVES